MSKRGIIITPKFKFDGERLSTGWGFEPTSLRQYLLYWDKIDWPDNNIIGLGGEVPEIDFLSSLGILERTMVRYSSFSGNAGYALLDMQQIVFQSREERDPGTWSIAQHSDVLCHSNNELMTKRALEIDLYSAIPVPPPEVPLSDILEFKARRLDELINFRLAMDEMYGEILISGDIPRAKSNAIMRVERSLSDLNAVYSESFERRLLSSLKIELNIPSIMATSIGGMLIAPTFGLPSALGAAFGAILPAIKFDLALTNSRKTQPSLTPFAYLHQIQCELR